MNDVNALTPPLDRLRRAMMVRLTWQSLLRGSVVLAGWALVVILLDLLFILPASLRVVSWWIAAGLLAAVLVQWLSQLRAMSPLGLARLIEANDPQVGNLVSNAVQLSRQNITGDWSRGLRDRAMELGAKQVRRQSAGQLLPLPGRWVMAIGVVSAIWLILLLGFTPMWRATWPRLWEPFGEHPPFSLLQIQVQPGDALLTPGETCTIVAAIEPATDKPAWLIIEQDRQRLTLPMARQADGRAVYELGRLDRELTYHVQVGRAQSASHRLSLRSPPRLLRVDYRIDAPAYQHTARQTGPLNAATLTPPLGATLSLVARADHPIARGRLVVQTPDAADNTLPMQVDPQDPKAATAMLTVDRDMTLTLTLVDAAGLATSPRDIALRAAADQPPVVRFTAAGRALMAGAQAKIPLDFQARDDFGLVAVRLGLALDDQPGQRQPLSPAKLPIRQMTVVKVLDLASLGVTPGQRITVWLEAVDNHPGDANAAASEPVTIRIVPPSELAAGQLRDALRQLTRTAQQALTQAPDISPATLQALSDMIANVNEKLAAASNGSDDPQAVAALSAESQAIAGLAEAIAAAMQNTNDSAAGDALARALSDWLSQHQGTTPGGHAAGQGDTSAGDSPERRGELATKTPLDRMLQGDVALDEPVSREGGQSGAVQPRRDVSYPVEYHQRVRRYFQAIEQLRDAP